MKDKSTNMHSENIHELNGILHSALDEVYENMKASRVPEGNKYVQDVICQCNSVFKKVHEECAYPYSKECCHEIDQAIRDRFKEGNQYDDLLLGIMGNPDPETFESTYDEKLYKSVKEKTKLMFPLFSDEDHLDKLLTFSSDDSAILKIVPYLLTTYYIKQFGNAKIRMSVLNEFSKSLREEINKAGNYYRDAKASLKVFDYSDFLPEFYKCGRSNKSEHYDEIIDDESFFNCLKSDCDKILLTNDDNDLCWDKLLLAGEKSASPLSFWGQAVYKYCIFNIISAACLDVFQNYPYKPDFELSEELFESHSHARSVYENLLDMTKLKREQEREAMPYPYDVSDDDSEDISEDDLPAIISDLHISESQLVFPYLPLLDYFKVILKKTKCEQMENFHIGFVKFHRERKSND